MPLERTTQAGDNPFAAKLATHVDGATIVREMKKGTLAEQVVDLRRPEEYAKGHVPGAVNVPLDRVVAHAQEQPEGTRFVTLCYHIACMLSTKGAAALWDAGFPVRELLGGWETWEQKGYPVERSEEPGEIRAAA